MLTNDCSPWPMMVGLSSLKVFESRCLISSLKLVFVLRGLSPCSLDRDAVESLCMYECCGDVPLLRAPLDDARDSEEKHEAMSCKQYNSDSDKE